MNQKYLFLERGKGYSTEVINDIVNKAKKQGYDLIYCFVDADNEGAIRLYKKLGKVYDEDGPNDNGQYYVTFYDKNKLNESATGSYQEFIGSIKSPEQLMDWMNANITYDLPDEDYDDTSTFMTKTGEELWKTRTGHCAEQSYFEKDVLENLGYKCYLIFCKEENDAQDYGPDGSAHVFLIAEKDSKYYYFEHAMEHNRGIHEFSSIKDCIAFIAKNWWRYEDTSTKLVFRKMNAPITRINNADLAKECYKSPVIAITNISKNRIGEALATQKLYFLSDKNLDDEILKPRVPNNFLIKNGYEDTTTPRVCFAPSINQCLMGISQNLSGKEFYVHIPTGKYSTYKPSVNEVPDSKITDETWVTTPVKVKCIGKIKVSGDTGEDGHTYKYGNNKEAELYDWNYSWIEKMEEDLKTSPQFKYIINPQDNLELAKKLEPIIDNFTLPKYCTMRRDNCRIINLNVQDELKKHGFDSKITGGYFIVDNVNLVDAKDLKTLNSYNDWRSSGLSKPEYIKSKNYLDKDLGWYTYVPHYWLELDGLIIDRAWPMFSVALEKPITKERYTLKDFNEDLKDDAKKYFGTTDYAKVGFYINTDGTILDGSEHGKSNHRVLDHREVAKIMPDGTEGTTAMLAYMNEGNIRYIPETGSFEIMKKPTYDQYETIENIARRTGDAFVDFTTPNGDIIETIEYDSDDGPVSKLIGEIKRHFLGKEDLTEATRAQLVAASRNADPYKHPERGKNRFERKRFSKLSTQVKNYNNIDMNDFFKKDLLTVNIPVTGETKSYDVTVQFDGVVAEMARNIKSNQNKFEYRTVVQALTKVFNTANVKVKCSCDDFKYRFQHALIVSNDNVDGTDKDPGPGTTGMANTKGKGCKHVLLALANLDWLMKIASCIKNYISYMDENKHDLFIRLIFPKLYGITADEAIDKNLVPEDTNMDTDKHVIETINQWAANRGKIQKGSNVNPAKGKGSINIEKKD